jgi:hypothetical protein
MAPAREANGTGPFEEVRGRAGDGPDPQRGQMGATPKVVPPQTYST